MYIVWNSLIGVRKLQLEPEGEIVPYTQPLIVTSWFCVYGRDAVNYSTPVDPTWWHLEIDFPNGTGNDHTEHYVGEKSVLEKIKATYDEDDYRYIGFYPLRYV